MANNVVSEEQTFERIAHFWVKNGLFVGFLELNRRTIYFGVKLEVVAEQKHDQKTILHNEVEVLFVLLLNLLCT